MRTEAPLRAPLVSRSRRRAGIGESVDRGSSIDRLPEDAPGHASLHAGSAQNLPHARIPRNPCVPEETDPRLAFLRAYLALIFEVEQASACGVSPLQEAKLTG